MFGDGGFSQSCLLATRLVESGVRLVSVQLAHRDNFTRLKDTTPNLDDGLAGHFLRPRGWPAPNYIRFCNRRIWPDTQDQPARGRDHYPRAMFCILAGGSMPGGQVIGESTRGRKIGSSRQTTWRPRSIIHLASTTSRSTTPQPRTRNDRPRRQTNPELV